MPGIYAWASKDMSASEVHDRVVGHLVRTDSDVSEHEIESVWLTSDGVWMADLVGGRSTPFESISGEWPDRP